MKRNRCIKFFLICLVILLPVQMVAQTRNISGKVTSESGELLPGVNIVIKGENRGTVTDVDGKYSLTVPSSASALTFSFIGFITQEVEITSNNQIDVVLQTDVKSLGEVVVTALGIEREKKALGYSAQELQGSSMVEAREVNVANSLKGMVAGVNVSSSSGGPGGSSYVEIRGSSSLTGENQPLYVVDGIPIDNSNLDAASSSSGRDYGDGIGNINPDDIETISVLKGPSAASLYGARGANGVILITTKKASTKKGIGVDYNMNMTLETPNIIPRHQNVWGGGYGGSYGSFGKTTYEGEEYPLWTNSMYDHWGGKMDGRMIIMQGMPEYGPVAYSPQPDDNIMDFYRVGQTFTNNLAINGATGKTAIRLSISDMRNKHILPTSSFNRQTINLTFGSEITEKLRIDGKVNYIRQEGENRPEVGYGTSSGNPAVALNLLSRFVDLDWLKNYKRADGSMVNYIARAPHNPYWIVNEFLSSDTRDRLIGNFSIQYQITDWLSLKARTGTDFYGDNRFERIGIGTTGSSTIRGEVKNTNWNVREDNSDILLTANSEIFKDVNLTFSLGANHLSKYSKVVGFTGTNLLMDNVYHISNAANVTPRYGETRKKMNSVYGMAQFAYKSFLFLDITGRNDWSSTLGINNYSFFYPSVSTSFIFSDAFDLSGGIISFGKVRASFAQAGNDASPYQTKAGYTVSSQTYSNQKYAYISSRVPLANLKNELTSSYEFGTDIRFFNNRVGVDLTYYNSSTNNQIVPLPLSVTTGYSDRMINAGEIENKGFELLLNLRPIELRNSFAWDATINLSRNKSKVISLVDGVETLQLITQTYANIEARPGQPYGNIVGYKYLRNEDGELILKANGTLQRASTMEILGNIQPDLLGGITNVFSYKGLEFSALIDFRLGGQFFSYTRYYEMARGTGKFTENRGDGTLMIIEGVVLNADGTYSPNTTPVTPQNYYAPRAWSNIGEEFVMESAYVSLRQLSLGYKVPPSLLNNLPIKNIKFSIVARNLAYLYMDSRLKEMGLSPESSYSPRSAAQGLETFRVPTTKSIGFNLSFSF